MPSSMSTKSSANRMAVVIAPPGRILVVLQLERVLGFVAQQVHVLTTRQPPQHLAKAQGQQREAQRQHCPRNPLRDRQVLHLDADSVHLLHVGETADQHDAGVQQAQQRGHHRHHARGARPEQLDEGIDADVRTDAHAVGHADEDQAAEQHAGELHAQTKL
jgi:hypothetical protein